MSNQTNNKNMKLGKECCVCYQKENNIFTTYCGHDYCQSCYTRWVIRGNISCPMCSVPLIEEEEEVEEVEEEEEEEEEEEDALEGICDICCGSWDSNVPNDCGGINHNGICSCRCWTCQGELSICRYSCTPLWS